MTVPDRSAAWQLLTEYTQSESLRKHALAVEACMRAYARRLQPDSSEAEDKWAVTGLLHDFDYERWPSPPDPARGIGEDQAHPFVGSRILAERGYPEDLRRAILSHADYSGVARQTPMEHALFACDELAGFITAATLVRPDKSIHTLEAKSVRKRMKDKAFARAVSRDDIIKGAQELGVDLDQHIAFCIEAMRTIAGELGLAGIAPLPTPSVQ